MSAPAVIDTLEFACSGESASGTLPIMRFKRLDDVLFDAAGGVGYELRGGKTARNQPQLEIRITGCLHLQCQRCLGLLEYDVDISNTIVLVPRGVKADAEMAEPDAPDAIEANAELDVAGLIEDEILLSLPLAPRHPEGACTSRFERQHEMIAGQTSFAKLASLKRPRDKH
jgi:uncharacterized protein